MENAIIPFTVSADSSYSLLDLLYASVHESGRRQDFMAALSRQLEIDLAHIYLYHLDQGSVLRYSVLSQAPLFEAAIHDYSVYQSADTFRYRVAGVELLFQVLEDNQLGIALIQGATLIHLSGRRRRSTPLTELGPRHGQTLAYLLPHFDCLHNLFLKQQAQLPRLNAIRKIHAILPLPLLIRRLSDGVLVPNPSALAVLRRADGIKAVADPKVVSLSQQPLTWKLCRENKTLGLQAVEGEGLLPVFPLHTLPVGYEVYLLGELGLRDTDEKLLRDIFGFNAGEAKVCACALAGKNPADIATELALSINTVKARLKSIYRCLQVNSVAQLVVRLYFHPVYWATQSREAAPHQALW